MGAGPVVLIVTLRGGREVTGEHVGTQDGWVYLATGDEVVRVEQRLVVKYRNAEAGDE